MKSVEFSKLFLVDIWLLNNNHLWSAYQPTNGIISQAHNKHTNGYQAN